MNFRLMTYHRQGEKQIPLRKIQCILASKEFCENRKTTIRREHSTIMTFPIEIDETQFSAIRFNIPGVIPAPQPTQPEDAPEHIGLIEPGTYKIYVVAGITGLSG